MNDYSEVKNAIVSSDGSPSLFMMNDKDVFYIKKVGEDGRTILKSFDYTPEQIESFINQAYQQTSQIMAKYGKTTNPIGNKVNKWDKYIVYNIICADYPLSHGGDN